MQSSIENSESFAVIAITESEALVWRNGIGSEDLPERVLPPVEVDHRHVRTGENHHGHDTDRGYPEYFEGIADLVRDRKAVLLIGHGHGKGSAAEQFLDFLERKHPNLGQRVVETIQINIPALSEGELKSHARQWFEKNFRKLATWHDRSSEKWFKTP